MKTVTATRERPILFSGPMVRAILAGSKTQTRRIVKPQPLLTADMGWIQPRGSQEKTPDAVNDPPYGRGEALWKSESMCPYGRTGERLWVRETFGDRADYAAIGALRKDRYYYEADGRKSGWKYRPSIHMPRAASRITLEITGVRVERLNEISDSDAFAEGCQVIPPRQPNTKPGYVFEGTRADRCNLCHKSPQTAFACLWDEIHGEDSWESNPWVWVVEFQRAAT